VGCGCCNAPTFQHSARCDTGLRFVAVSFRPTSAFLHALAVEVMPNVAALLVPFVLVLAAVAISRKRGARRAAADERPVFGSGKMFDKIAKFYDMGNRFMSLGQDQKWRIALLREAAVTPDDAVLDLATGSADVAIAAREVFRCKSVIGLDPSVEMLNVGRMKTKHLTGIQLVEGDAQSMPQFRDGQFDKITMSFGIRNVSDRVRALSEARRLLKLSSSSRLAIMEFSAPQQSSIVGKAARLFVRHVVPLIGSLITNASEEYQYLEESIFKFPSPADFAAIIESCGFDMVSISSLAAGVVNIYIARPRHPAQ
jgi:demethylmenaquinone methyltransferase/2-methoxy-6-polyprenyl-1,4-benzoquinol methylase